MLNLWETSTVSTHDHITNTYHSQSFLPWTQSLAYQHKKRFYFLSLPLFLLPPLFPLPSILSIREYHLINNANGSNMMFFLLIITVEPDGSDFWVGGDVGEEGFAIGQQEDAGGDEGQYAVFYYLAGDVIEVEGVLIPVGVVEQQDSVEDN
jgi:hypothetical protein